MTNNVRNLQNFDYKRKIFTPAAALVAPLLQT